MCQYQSNVRSFARSRRKQRRNRIPAREGAGYRKREMECQLCGSIFFLEDGKSLESQSLRIYVGARGGRQVWIYHQFLRVASRTNIFSAGRRSAWYIIFPAVFSATETTQIWYTFGAWLITTLVIIEKGEEGWVSVPLRNWLIEKKI